MAAREGNTDTRTSRPPSPPWAPPPWRPSPPWSPRPPWQRTPAPCNRRTCMPAQVFTAQESISLITPSVPVHASNTACPCRGTYPSHPDIHPIHPRNIEKHPCSGSPQRQKTTSTSGWGATSMGPLQRRTSEQQCSTVITRCEGDDHKHMIVDACEDDDHKHRMFDCRCLQIR